MVGTFLADLLDDHAAAGVELVEVGPLVRGHAPSSVLIDAPQARVQVPATVITLTRDVVTMVDIQHTSSYAWLLNGTLRHSETAHLSFNRSQIRAPVTATVSPGLQDILNFH